MCFNIEQIANGYLLKKIPGKNETRDSNTNTWYFENTKKLGEFMELNLKSLLANVI